MRITVNVYSEKSLINNDNEPKVDYESLGIPNPESQNAFTYKKCDILANKITMYHSDSDIDSFGEGCFIHVEDVGSIYVKESYEWIKAKLDEYYNK